MGVILSGFSDLAANLMNIADRSSRGAREELAKGAEDIKDLAVLYAPIDEGNLERAIKVQKFSDVSNNRRNTYSVYVDEDVAAKNSKTGTVGGYAVRMHEGDYELGVLSQDKQDSANVKVGRKFLERALEDLDQEIKRKTESRIGQGVGH
jgi:hypothetical protein